MLILSIDTSCDETSVAVTKGRRILANEIYSQILIHKKWGGVVPSLAKRAHEEKIDLVIQEALRKFHKASSTKILSRLNSSPPIRRVVKQKVSKNFVDSSNKEVVDPVADFPPASARYKHCALPACAGRSGTLPSVPPTNYKWHQKFKNIDYVAVTYGPGLAVALEVGIGEAKTLAQKYHKKIIPVNHMEGHIYSCFTQNRKGNPKREFHFPYLSLLISGGHTELVVFKSHLHYEIIGETIDDAAGESLDKAAKMLRLGYPGGPIIERLAKFGDPNYHKFPRPLYRSKDLNFSFSGLKTSFYYFIKNLNDRERIKNLNNLASSFQEAVFDTLLNKLEQAMNKTKIKNILVAGGVAANLYLRKKVRDFVAKRQGKVLFPPFKNLYGDNAAMVGVAAYYKALRNIFVDDLDKFDRIPRSKIGGFV